MLQTARALSVLDFYSGKSIFITGCTGFLGKVLLEKLLYSCSDVDRVYVLMRKASLLTEKQRLEEFIQNPVFTRLKEQRPQDMAKIIPVEGDLVKPNLGISSKDEEILLEKVSIVFHIAATINFNAPLREALQMNVEGTRKVLELSRRMNRLQAFEYVSTAYSNCNRPKVEEVVYPPPATLEDVYRVLDQHENDENELKKLLAGHPNTYTFTKALAETLVAETRGDMPVAILRPSIVLPSKIEPVEGWVDCWQGAIILLHAVAKGWLRVMRGSKTVVADIIPVDYVANMAIVAATTCLGSSNVAVYNCCTGEVNPTTWHNVTTLYADEAVRKGFNNLPFPFMYWTQNAYMVMFITFLTQTTPAHLLDLWLMIKGRKPRYAKNQPKLSALRHILEHFTESSWDIRTERARALAEALSPGDLLRFPCHPADVRWNTYLPVCFEGMERYLCKI